MLNQTQPDKFFLGIDPGLADCGYAVMTAEPGGYKVRAVEYAVWSSPKSWGLPARLLFIQDSIKKLSEKYTFTRVGIERLFFQRNITSAMSVSEARGVIMATLASLKVPIIEFTPNEVKQILTGFGSADKRQIGLTVKMLLSLKTVPKPDDITDAIAIAIATAWHQTYPKN